MPKLPRVKPKKVIQALKRAGYYVARIHGSHYIMYKNDQLPAVTVPMHRKELKLATLTSILKQAKLSVKDLIELL